LKVEDVIMVQDSWIEMPTFSSCSMHHRLHKGGMMKNGRVTELCTALKIQLSNLIEEIVRFIRPTTIDDRWLPADLPKLGLLAVEGLA